MTDKKVEAKMKLLCQEEFLKAKKAIDPHKALLEEKTKQTLNFIFNEKKS